MTERKCDIFPSQKNRSLTSGVKMTLEQGRISNKPKTILADSNSGKLPESEQEDNRLPHLQEIQSGHKAVCEDTYSDKVSSSVNSGNMCASASAKAVSPDPECRKEKQDESLVVGATSAENADAVLIKKIRDLPRLIKDAIDYTRRDEFLKAQNETIRDVVIWLRETYPEGTFICEADDKIFEKIVGELAESKELRRLLAERDPCRGCIDESVYPDCDSVTPCPFTDTENDRG